MGSCGRHDGCDLDSGYRMSVVFFFKSANLFRGWAVICGGRSDGGDALMSQIWKGMAMRGEGVGVASACPVVRVNPV